MTIQQYIRRIALFEKFYTRKLLSILKEQMDAAADTLETSGIEMLRNQVDKLLVIDGLGKIIRDLYVQVGLWSGNRTIRGLRKDVKEKKAGFGFDENWTREIINFFRTYLLTKAVIPISADTRKQIMDVLEKGFTKGWSIDQMATSLRSPELILWRARMIARTEISKAQFYGTELGKRDSGYQTVTEWISVNDTRTRHSHKLMDGKKVKEGDKFKVPRYRGKVLIGYDLMNGPGDPDASAGNVINCRCTVAVRAARDKKGRIIPRPSGDFQTLQALEKLFVLRF